MKKTAWNKGRTWSQAVRDRISEGRKGKPAWNKGKTWSQAVRDKVSKGRKGKPAWNKGKAWSEATKERISLAKRGHATWNKGKTWSEEIRGKISTSRKGRQAWNKGLSWSQEVRRKIQRTKLAKEYGLQLPDVISKRASKRTRYLVLKRDNFTCQNCGGKAPQVQLEVDHVTPRSKGGDDSLRNLTTLCSDCNRGKSNLT